MCHVCYSIERWCYSVVGWHHCQLCVLNYCSTWNNRGYECNFYKRSKTIFNATEEFILSIDELNNEVVIWDAMTTDIIAKWPSDHVGAPRWLEHSPVESAFYFMWN